MVQHLAYQPLHPSGNKYLQQKWDQSSYDLHIRKIKSALPTINTRKTYDQLSLKQKKLKLDEEWTIKKENGILRDKILRIKRTTGRVDNRNFYEKKSLGKEKRQLELSRITKENQMILFRLSQCKSQYNVKSWHEDWLKTLKMMDAIARYPRGRETQQKGQENTSKRSWDCNKGKISVNKTTDNSNYKTSGKGKSNVRTEIIREEDTREETHKKTTTHTVTRPNVPAKSKSPEIPEDPI